MTRAFAIFMVLPVIAIYVVRVFFFTRLAKALIATIEVLNTAMLWAAHKAVVASKDAP